MAEVQWINGELNPPSSKEYYIAIEAQEDIGGFKKGDVEITSDWFDKDSGCFDTIGKDNPSWKVLCWANMLHPAIPHGLHDRVKIYCGVKVGSDNE